MPLIIDSPREDNKVGARENNNHFSPPLLTSLLYPSLLTPSPYIATSPLQPSTTVSARSRLTL
ncbi:hypothetical protein J6590_074600 [Homalodisca vitripennis]|nr:hypothetical protein J6590_074600 [Homalodisca vitripennis]